MHRKALKAKLVPKRENSAGNRPPFECIALLLQGGGALGAYQAGVYQALSEAGLEPDWVAGISIGAINAAIIAGNAPEIRLQKLQEFWEYITVDDFRYYDAALRSSMLENNMRHQTINIVSAIRTTMCGISGFFQPRFLAGFFEPRGSIAATSFYDLNPLKNTLERLIDFDRINNDNIRFNIGAVNVKSGNFTDFDNDTTRITPEHIMASGALPPGFQPIEIDGEYYWDGGLISNTPLQWLLENKLHQDTLVFQVDLWSADGEFPKNMAEVLTRQKDIQYSSRTRSNTDRFKEVHKIRHSLGVLLEKLPPELKNLPETKLLSTLVDNNVYNIVHLIYHNKSYEGYSKDYEFSRISMEAHWEAGYNDTVKTIQHPEVLQRPPRNEGVAVFDFCKKLHDKDTNSSAERPLKHKSA